MGIKILKTNWIIEYICVHGRQNIYNMDFVKSYIERFDIKENKYDKYGFLKVPELNRYLRELCQKKILNRTIEYSKKKSNLSPAWYYSYGIETKKSNLNKYGAWIVNAQHLTGEERLKWTFEMLDDAVSDSLKRQDYETNKKYILHYIKEISNLYDVMNIVDYNQFQSDIEKYMKEVSNGEIIKIRMENGDIITLSKEKN